VAVWLTALVGAGGLGCDSLRDVRNGSRPASVGGGAELGGEDGAALGGGFDGLLAVGELEEQGRQERGHEGHEDCRGEEGALDHTGRRAGRGDDQRDLAAGHHADTDAAGPRCG
jgi:hypothetical protein